MQSRQSDPAVTGVVLGAGGSIRLGRSKRLLPYDKGHGHPIAQADLEVSAVGAGGSAQTFA